MSEEQENVGGTAEGTPRWIGLAVAVLAVVSAAGLAFGWSASSRATTAEQNLARNQDSIQDLLQQVGTLNSRLVQAEEANSEVRGELSVVTDRLKLTRGELARARKQAKQFSEEYAKQLEQIDASVKSELATKASADDVSVLSGDVSGVRSDLDATREGLHLAKGELGTLIARNHEEIETLRRIGQRDYYEFNIEKKGTRRRVGELVIELRGTNTKKNLFTVALFADDLRFEKKNRSVNEPIYFYTRGYRSPLELVVNKVGKNQIVGYISVPKGSATVASGN